MTASTDLTSLFEEIKEKCLNKKVTGLCNKLIKKLSFSSGSDAENLCHLAYWLYVLEQTESAERCIDLTHNLVFDQNYNVWAFIHQMWGLEIRILREKGENEKAESISKTISEHHKIPLQSSKETQEHCDKREAARRENFTFADTSKQEKVNNAGDDRRTNDWRFIALLGLIGYTETGLYPHLSKDRKIIEQTISEYISKLRSAK